MRCAAARKAGSWRCASSQGQARRRRMQRDRRTRAPARVAHRHGHGDQAGDELLAVAGTALRRDDVALSPQRLGVGDGVTRHARQRQLRDQRVAFRCRHLCQEQLAAGRAVQRHVRAHVQRQPQRPLRLDAVDVEHLRAVQRGEVAGLAHLRHQCGQHLVAQAAHDAVVQRVEGQPAQRRADGEAAFVDVARQEAAVQQLRAQPVRRHLGQAQAHRQLGQRQRAPLLRQQRQQAQAALGRRTGGGRGFTVALAAWHRLG